MTEQTHDITDLPKKSNETRQKIKTGVAIGIFAAGVFLLIDDQVKKLSARKNGTAETPED